MNITPITGSPAAADVAADLRALADLVENDGDGFVAAMIPGAIASTVWPAHCVSYDRTSDRRDYMAEAIRRFKSVAVGSISKNYRDGGEGYFDALVPMRALTIRLTELRAEVCERVVTGVETITEEVPDPEYIAAAPKILQTREVETYEWKCAPILAASAEAGE
ncbi:hypothetical protein ACW2Q0_28450 [Nocardia sp. R16R-3T]